MKFQYMRKLLTLLCMFLVLTFHLSCEVYDEDVVELIGSYEGHVATVSGPFSFNVIYDAADNLIIEAPFFGSDYTIISVDIDQEEQFVKSIDVPTQLLFPGVEIFGSGFYVDRSLQIDYVIREGSIEQSFTLVGTKN